MEPVTHEDVPSPSGALGNTLQPSEVAAQGTEDWSIYSPTPSHVWLRVAPGEVSSRH